MGESTTDLTLSDEGFSDFDIEELAVFDVNTAVALPDLGASGAHGWFCCSSSSSSSCCL
ncbi:MAG: thiazolylpeptide-type bacteriocin [Acidimicrobiales bacterium]